MDETIEQRLARLEEQLARIEKHLESRPSEAFNQTSETSNRPKSSSPNSESPIEQIEIGTVISRQETLAHESAAVPALPVLPIGPDEHGFQESARNRQTPDAPALLGSPTAPAEIRSPQSTPVAPNLRDPANPPPLPPFAGLATAGISRGENVATTDVKSSEFHPAPPPLPSAVAQQASPISPLDWRRTRIPPSVSGKQKPAGAQRLEQAIGLKWAGWIGAVILLIGAALGVKYAYEQHWFAQLPAWLWPTIIAAFGFALIGAGEWVYRRVNVVPAASLFGAGVATLFLVSYIGHSYYQLYSPTTAFILMAITTLIGSAVAMRGRLVSVAVLSLIGGNIAPLVMGDRGAPHSTFMAYLLMLQVVALSLAWWGQSRRWWTLRGLSLATTTLWMSGIIGADRDGILPLWFAIAFAALYHIEVIASAMRADRSPEKSRAIRHGGSVFVTLVMAALAAAILAVLHDASPAIRAGWVIAQALACAVIAFALKDPRRRLTRSLTTGYTVSAAALFALAIPVALDGLGVEIGWAILAIVLSAVGRSVGSRTAHRCAVAAWSLALLHLVFTSPGLDIFHERQSSQIWMTLWGVQIISATIRAWCLAVVGHVLAVLMQPRSEEAPSPIRDANAGASSEISPVSAFIDPLERAAQPGRQASAPPMELPASTSSFARTPGSIANTSIATLAATVAFVATVIWVSASILSLPPLGATLCMVAFAWVLLAVDFVSPRSRLSAHFITLLLVATMKWVLVDTLGQRLAPGWSADMYRPIFNPLMGVGMLLAGSLIAIRETLKRAKPQAVIGLVRSTEKIIPLLALFVFAWTGSFEIDRWIQLHPALIAPWPMSQFKQMSWTIWWTMCALVGVAIGSRDDRNASPGAPWAKLLPAILLLLAIKFILVDALAWRSNDPATPATLFINMQSLTAMFVIGSLLLEMFFSRVNPLLHPVRVKAGFMAMILALVAISLEVDRYFESERAAAQLADPRLAKQVAFSIVWSVFAVLSVAGGFRLRLAWLRYFGLALLAITLLKVVTVDLGQFSTGYRILSFLGLGLLMLGTSVLYGKLSPRLLGTDGN